MPRADFLRQLTVDDQYETIRRQRLETTIAGLLEDSQKTAAQQAEEIRRAEYDHAKELRIADHKEEKRQEKASSDIKRLPRLRRRPARTAENELRALYMLERESMTAQHDEDMRRIRQSQRGV